MFICAIALIRSSVCRIVAALFLSLFCIMTFHQLKPYHAWTNNVLAEICHYFLALLFFGHAIALITVGLIALQVCC